MKVSYVLKSIPLGLMFLLFMPLETIAMDSGYVHIRKENIDNRPPWEKSEKQSSS